MPTTKTASSTTTRRRPSSSVSVQKQSIHQATQHLAQLPEKPRDAWSLREAIEQLKDPIDGALTRGYTHEEIAGMLSERGVKISPSSLKSYLAATRKEKDGGKTKRAAKPRAKKASTTEAAPKTTRKKAAPAEVAAPVPAEAAPAKTKRAPRSTSAAPTKTAAKTRGRAAAKAEKPPAKATRTTSTRGRKKKETT